MDAIGGIESSLRAFEELLGVSLTVVDNKGSLHDVSGRALFPQGRQSHKKNPICAAGFCDRCVGHCRYETLRRAERNSLPFFIHRCWKGAVEVVAPVRKGKLLVGLVYAGIWREPGRTAPREARLLPARAARIYAELEAFDEARASLIGRALSLVNAGIVAEIDAAIRLDGSGSQGRREIVRSYVFANASSSASLGGLAKTLGLSSSRTGHLVSELFGRSFESLVLEERLKRAKSLLLSTELSAGEIASLAGFSDQFFFSKAFRRAEGLPPGAFRRKAAAG